MLDGELRRIGRRGIYRLDRDGGGPPTSLGPAQVEGPAPGNGEDEGPELVERVDVPGRPAGNGEPYLAGQVVCRIHRGVSAQVSDEPWLDDTKDGGRCGLVPGKRGDDRGVEVLTTGGSRRAHARISTG